MREPRYRRSGLPEREDYNRWVTEGWQAVVREGQGESGVVHVRAYTRTRDGRTEQVGAHTRAGPAGGGATGGSRGASAAPDADQAHVQLAQAQIFAVPVVGGAMLMTPLVMSELGRRLPALTRRNLLDRAIEGERRGSIAPRSWYNSIPEQPGERAAAEEAEAEARGVPSPGGTSSAPDAAEPERPRYTVHPGQQGKHQPGHNNYDPRRSEIDPNVDVQALVDRHAHRGTPVNRIPTGQAGSRERFDNGDEVIGIHRDRDGTSAPTTQGITHYGADRSVHVVPARPRR